MKKSTFSKFLWLKLPIAAIAGVKLKHYNEDKVQTSVKFSWWNQNPFKSMFWAVQGMAAELSTGTLCLSKIKNSKRKISMLVVGLEADFTKKAVGKITFTCEQGKEIEEVICRTIKTEAAQQIRLKSIGKDEAGNRVAEFYFTWSFKLRS